MVSQLFSCLEAHRVLELLFEQRDVFGRLLARKSLRFPRLERLLHCRLRLLSCGELRLRGRELSFQTLGDLLGRRVGLASCYNLLLQRGLRLLGCLRSALSGHHLGPHLACVLGIESRAAAASAALASASLRAFASCLRSSSTALAVAACTESAA